jgi:hypothetical protein
MSHPTTTDPGADNPSTGYTTLPTTTGRIQTYYFVSSPDTRNNRPKTWENGEMAERYFRDQSGRMNNDFPEGVGIARSSGGRFILVKDGRPFARVFAVRMSVDELGNLVQGLCNHLAQPVQEAWDGETIAELVA